MKRGQRKGISPIIATVILIIIVIIIAILIFLWARSVGEDAVEKRVNDEPVPAYQVCGAISFSAVVTSNNDLQISNSGSIPIYNLHIVKKSSGSEVVQDYATNIGPGQPATIGLGSTTYDEVEVFPVFLGQNSETGAATPYTCQNDGKIAGAP